MNDVLDRYELDRVKRIKAHTAAVEIATLKQFRAWWRRECGNASPKSLKPFHLEDFFWGLGGLAETLQHSSLNTKMVHIRSLIKWMSTRGYLREPEGSYLEKLKKVAEQDTEHRYLTAAQLVEIYSNIEDDPWERFVVASGVYMSGRDCELTNIRRGHVKLDRGVIRIYRNKTDKGDGSAWDEMPLLPEFDLEVRRWLIAYQEHMGQPIQDDWYLFPRRHRTGYGGQQWTYLPDRRRMRMGTVIAKHLDNFWGERLPGERRGQHDLRRSAARAMYEYYKDLYGAHEALMIVQAHLGHRSPETTKRYIGISVERARRDEALIASPWLGGSTNITPIRKRLAGGS